MATLTVYGKRNGTEKVIFGNLFDSPAAMRKAKQTANKTDMKSPEHTGAAQSRPATGRQTSRRNF